MNLPTQSFLALAAIAWGDGSMQRNEAAGLLRAAREAGLSAAEIAVVESAAKKRIELADVEVESLSEWHKVLTYSLAAWVAQVDGVVSTSESQTIAALGDRLGLSEAIRKRAAAAANDIACQPGGGKPELYDFQGLATRLRERLPQVK
jgi:tellurite resistance protein